MTNLRLATGIGSTAGGSTWVATWLVHNSQPEGCIGAVCVDRAMRSFSPAAAVFLTLSGTALAVCGCLLLLQVRERRGHLGATGTAAGGLSALGLILLVAAGVCTYLASDWEGMPTLVVPGVTFLAAGSVLIAGVVVRNGILPSYLALGFAVAALLLPFANEQTSRILLAVPFGLAWAAAGGLMLARPRALARASFGTTDHQQDVIDNMDQ